MIDSIALTVIYTKQRFLTEDMFYDEIAGANC